MHRRIFEEMQRFGGALPCTLKEINGAIVTLNIDIQDGVHTFPPITCPAHQSKYVREPFQPGDTGIVIPMRSYIGNVSGLGGGQSNGQLQGNLSTLVFFPTGATSYQSVDGNMLVLGGPSGTKIGKLGSVCTIVATDVGIVITNGDIVCDGISLKNHLHSGVQSGGDQSGPPVPGT